ncbi:ABC transporter substrate-binding protein [Treponema peruense]|uniref:ABC transporter substrate-binding protein n=1 Tax=Treponema peruense TaxID=2787628 RepID=A0A7T3RD40_9SPIR|nr:ABC transporter substrate-binding protein [Treponema peruense]QQA00891.1 ABC transporter substrate-binding protein [Treponema peruense]
MKKGIKNVLLGTAVVSAMMMAASCSGKKNDTIKIGGIAPLSGGVAVYGVECKNGIDLAVEEINAAGGINGQKIEFICEDDEGDSAKSVNAYKKLVTKDRVKVIIGSLTSGCTMAITNLAQAQKVVQIAPAATAVAITDAGNYVFRACYTDPFQGKIGGKFAYENLGTKKAAILYDIGNDYSVGLTDNFTAEYTSMGGSIVSKESYSTGDKDFNAQLTKIKAANPEVIYLPDYYGTVALIAKQLRAQGINVPIVGADGWDGLTDNAGDEVLNGYYSNHYSEDSSSAAVQTFVKAFKAKYNKAPNSFAVLGYDCVYMLRDAIKASGSTDDSAKIRDALEATNGDYVTGHIVFDANRNPIKSAVMIKLVKADDGKLATAYEATVDISK